MQQQSSIKYYIALISWFLLMSISLFMPAEDLSAPRSLTFPGADKVVHFVLFAVFTFLAIKTAEKSKRSIPTWIIAALIIFYAVGTEIIQSWISGRNGDVWDLMADIFGVTAVLVFFKILR